jgi:shikimate kinase
MTGSSKIVLIGFMGSGKTTVAAQLAPMLGVALYEMDMLIVETSGVDSIPTIFELYGEPKFRELETAVAKSLANVREAVISTGGGVVGNPENMSHLRANGGTVVYLKTDFDTVRSRIGNLSSRPLFKDPTRASDLYHARAPIYEAAADIIIRTDDISTEEVAQRIYSEMRNQK